MMDEQDCDTVFVCQCFQCTNITVVVGVRISIVTAAADALQCVDDYETCIGVLR